MHVHCRCAVIGALAIATAATAQPRLPDAAQPDAIAPPLHYPSAFADYKPLRDDAVGNWRTVNDRVREAAAKVPQAGHGAATAAPAKAPAPASAAPGPRAPAGHRDQHGMHPPGGRK